MRKSYNDIVKILQWKLSCKRSCVEAYESINNKDMANGYWHEAICIEEILMVLNDDTLYKDYLKEAKKELEFD